MYASSVLDDWRADQIEGSTTRDVFAPVQLGKPEMPRWLHQCIGAMVDRSYVNGCRENEPQILSPSDGPFRQTRKDGCSVAMPYTVHGSRSAFRD